MKVKALIITGSALLILMIAISLGIDKSPPQPKEQPLEPNLTQLSDTSFTYSLTNNTEQPVTFQFNSGQRFDYTISSDDKIVYQLSDEMMYTQVLGEMTLPAGTDFSHTIDVPSEFTKEGTYVISAWLTTSTGKQHEATLEFDFSE